VANQVNRLVGEAIRQIGAVRDICVLKGRDRPGAEVAARVWRARFAAADIDVGTMVLVQRSPAAQRPLPDVPCGAKTLGRFMVKSWPSRI